MGFNRSCFCEKIHNGGRRNAGRKPKYGARVILNAIFYVLRSGCAWHLLPHDFPPYQTVYTQFQRWQRKGIFIQLHDYVRGRLRPILDKAVNPTGAIIDSQSVKTAEKRGSVDMTQGKKIKGRKRHIAVDTQGFLLQAHITSANVSDKQGCKKLLRSKRLKTVKKIWVDAGYQGKELQEIAEKKGKDLEVVKRPPGRLRIYNEELKAEWIPIERPFSIMPRRWVVERTFAWIGKYRRMSKDYDYLSYTSESMIYLCMTRTMINRYKLVA